MPSAKPPKKDKLHVVTCLFNPVRFASRYALYRDFSKHVRDSGAELITVEAAFGNRDFVLRPGCEAPATCGSVRHVTLRVGQDQDIWLKENLLNIGVQHLPADAKYVAFVDADVHFVRPDWVTETLHCLQHFDVAQMFSTAIDLSPTNEVLQMHRGFAFCHLHRTAESLAPAQKQPGATDSAATPRVHLHHPGFAWAWRRTALDTVGGLLDQAILGSADRHMAWALVGEGTRGLPAGLTADYVAMVRRWETHARALTHNVGYVNGTLLHRWHGSKQARGYRSRWQVLIDHEYSPANDLKRDSNGIIALNGNKPGLRDAIREYFRSRNEDCIFVPVADQELLQLNPG